MFDYSFFQREEEFKSTQTGGW